MHIAEKYKFWSSVNPYPVTFYDPELSTWLTYWNGKCMIFEHALIIASIRFLRVYPTGEMRSAADRKFKQFRNTHFLKEAEPTDEVNVHTYFLVEMLPHLRTLTDITGEQIYNWFENALRNKYDTTA